LVLASPTSGGRSVGIVRLRTKATELCIILLSRTQNQIGTVLHVDRCFADIVHKEIFLSPNYSTNFTVAFICEVYVAAMLELLKLRYMTLTFKILLSSQRF
jgi:hypothetical protein